MTIELKQEILDLIESPELYAYLMKYTERLKLRDYVEIIAGAPVSLKRKLGLLHKLRATTDLKQRDMEYMKLCCECMNQAVRYLTMESRTIFLIQLMGYDDDNKSDIMDGPYIMTSLEDMKKAAISLPRVLTGFCFFVFLAFNDFQKFLPVGGNQFLFQRGCFEFHRNVIVVC